MARHLTSPPRTRSVGVEIAALWAIARPRLRELLAELGLGPSLLAVVGNVVGRVAHLASEAGDATLAVGAQRAGVRLSADFETMGSMRLHRASDAPRATCSSPSSLPARAAVHDPHLPRRSTAGTRPLRHAPPAVGERPLGRWRPSAPRRPSGRLTRSGRLALRLLPADDGSAFAADASLWLPSRLPVVQGRTLDEKLGVRGRDRPTPKLANAVAPTATDSVGAGLTWPMHRCGGRVPRLVSVPVRLGLLAPDVVQLSGFRIWE